jgi:dihydrofolate reductase
LRELCLFIATSEDGYIAMSDGSIDWLTLIPFSEGEDGGFYRMYEQIDTIVMGRKTFEHVIQLSDGIYPHQDRETILITSNESYPIQALQHGNQISLMHDHVVEEISRLKKKNGKSIWLCGGSTIINSFMHAGIIDKLIITVVPVRLGEGIPLWDEDSQSLLQHWRRTEERKFNGCTQTIYVKEIGK